MDPLRGHITPLFFRYAIPTILGMLSLSSSAIIDAIFLGQYVGAHALAAVNITVPVWLVLIGITLMLAVGGSVMCGKFIGEQRYLEARSLFNKIVITILIIALIVCTVGLIFQTTLLTWLGANATLLPLTEDYFFIALAFAPALMLGSGMYYFMRVDNNPLLASTALIASAVVNIILDWLLIAVFDFGIKGAAWATGFSQVAILAVALPHFFFEQATLRFMKPRGSWREVWQAATNGVSEFLNESSVGITTLIFNWVMITRLGAEGVAAFAVVNYILWFGLMAAFAIGDSLHPLISKNFGAKNPLRIGQFLRIGVLSVLVVGIVMIALMLLAPNIFIAMFLEPDEVATMTVATQFVAWVWPVFLFNGTNIALSAYLTAMHKPLQSAVIGLSRSLVLPILCLVTLPLWWGETGIFIALPIAELLTFFIALQLFRANRPQRLVTMD